MVATSVSAMTNKHESKKKLLKDHKQIDGYKTLIGLSKRTSIVQKSPPPSE
jgi:hypothetical protein